MSIIWRHILIGADSAFSRCRRQDAGLGTWDYLKFRLQQLKLQHCQDDNRLKTFTKADNSLSQANCLRVRVDGPIMGIYPDDVWYRQAVPEVIEQIIQERLISNLRRSKSMLF